MGSRRVVRVGGRPNAARATRATRGGAWGAAAQRRKCPGPAAGAALCASLSPPPSPSPPSPSPPACRMPRRGRSCGPCRRSRASSGASPRPAGMPMPKGCGRGRFGVQHARARQAGPLGLRRRMRRLFLAIFTSRRWAFSCPRPGGMRRLFLAIFTPPAPPTPLLLLPAVAAAGGGGGGGGMRRLFFPSSLLPPPHLALSPPPASSLFPRSALDGKEGRRPRLHWRRAGR